MRPSRYVGGTNI